MSEVFTKYDFEKLTGKKGLVAFFYPRAGSKDCSLEIEVFNHRLKDIQSTGYNLVGISTDTLEANQEFAKEHELGYPLISDIDKSITKRFGDLTTVVRDGKEIERPLRTTYIMDNNDKIIAQLPDVVAISSANEVLKKIEELNK